jgi:hypothetical protein
LVAFLQLRSTAIVSAFVLNFLEAMAPKSQAQKGGRGKGRGAGRAAPAVGVGGQAAAAASDALPADVLEDMQMVLDSVGDDEDASENSAFAGDAMANFMASIAATMCSCCGCSAKDS